MRLSYKSFSSFFFFFKFPIHLSVIFFFPAKCVQPNLQTNIWKIRKLTGRLLAKLDHSDFEEVICYQIPIQTH